MSISAVGTRITQQAAPTGGVSTMSVTPGAINNIFLCATQVASATSTCTAVSGGNCIWQLVPNTTIGGTNINSHKLWLGIASAAAAQNISFTWSGAPGNPCTTAQQFASSLGTSAAWRIVDSNNKHNAASASLVYPTVVADAAGELLVGYGSTSTAGTSAAAGSTTTPLAGCVWQTDGFASELVYNLSVAAGNVVANPAVNTPSAQTSDSIAAIISDVLLAAFTKRPSRGPNFRR